jgi:hypothetical protein
MFCSCYGTSKDDHGLTCRKSIQPLRWYPFEKNSFPRHLQVKFLFLLALYPAAFFLYLYYFTKGALP